MPLLGTFTDADPELGIDLQLSDRYVDIADESVDIAVRIGKLADSGPVARRPAKVDIRTVASPACLSRHGPPRVPDDLEGHACVGDTNFRSGAARPYVVDGTRRSIGTRGPMLLDSARSVRDLVLDGRGGLCPSHVVAEDVREKRLRRVLSRRPGPSLEAYAVHAGGRNLARKVRRRVEHLRKSFDVT